MYIYTCIYIYVYVYMYTTIYIGVYLDMKFTPTGWNTAQDSCT